MESTFPVGEYTLSNAWEQARTRVRVLEATYDLGTIRRLDAIGVGPGWRCLELGAGAGSIARRLAELAGPGGHVVAADLDTSLLEASLAEHGPSGAPIEIRATDLREERPEAGAYDLVHARLVFSHLPDPAAAVGAAVAALRPGGWLLLEDFDDFAWGSLDDGLFPRVMLAGIAGMRRAGSSTRWGRRLPESLAARGLVDVRADCEVPYAEGGAPAVELVLMTIEQLREQGLLTGIDAAEVTACLTEARVPGRWYVGLGLVAAWGRRPGQGTGTSSRSSSTSTPVSST